MKNIVLKLTFILMICSPAFSADENIDMLNRLGKEINVYSKKIVNVDVGDTVNWKSVNPGHNVEFIKGGIPEGVEKFKSKYTKILVILSKLLGYTLIGVHHTKVWE